MLLIALTNAPFRLAAGLLKISLVDIAISVLLVCEAVQLRRSEGPWVLPRRGFAVAFPAFLVWEVIRFV